MNAVAQVSATGNERIAMGGNQPPEVIVFEEIEAYYEEARNFASDGFKIENQEQADQIDALVLLSGDMPDVDAAYDDCVSATLAVLAKVNGGVA